jgi:hypothetical protein
MYLLPSESRRWDVWEGHYVKDGTWVDFAVGSTALNPGDHVCALYSGSAGRDEVLVRYLLEGIREGDRCICFLEDADRRGVVEQLRSLLGERAPMASEQVTLLEFDQTYLRHGGLSQDGWFEFLDQRLGATGDERGSPVTRAAGEMTWSHRTTRGGGEVLCSHEAKLNHFASRRLQILLCLYDVQRFNGEVVIDVLRAHRKVISSNMIVDNPFYVESELSHTGCSRAG